MTLSASGGGRAGPSAYEVYTQAALEAGDAPLDRDAWVASLVGPVGLDFAAGGGAWAAGTAYPVRAAVTHQGSLWRALRATTGDEPGASPDDWALVLPGVDIALYDDLLADATAERTAAQTARTAAEAARTGAELARDAAQTDAPVYLSTVAGLAATVPGDQFGVPFGIEVIRYRHDAGPPAVATEIARYPQARAVTGGLTRAQIALNNPRLAGIVVDRGAGTVSFPPLKLVPVGGGSTVVSGLDVYTTLPLSLALGSWLFYYVDHVDSTIKSSGDRTFTLPTATTTPLGWSENRSFTAVNGAQVRYVADEAQNVRVTARPGTSAGQGTEEVIVDRARQVVSFPSLTIWAGVQPGFFNVNPPGWPGVPRIDLPLSTDYAVPVYYYVNRAAGTFHSTTVHDDPLPSDNIIYIGSSVREAFSPLWGLRVRYLHPVDPPRGQSSLEGVARAAQAGFGPSQHGGREPYLHNGGKWHPVQPCERDAMLQSSGTGGLDLSYLSRGSRVLIQTFSNPTQVWAGRGRSFMGRAENSFTAPPNAAFEVSRLTDTRLIVREVVGTLSWSSITEPVMDRSILLAGQSQRERYATWGGIGGFARGLRRAGWVQSVVDTSIAWINGATGGTAIDRRSVTGGSTAYWWDAAANGGLGGPGPALDTCVAAMAANAAAGQPAPAWVFWAQGESDASALETGALTVAQMQASILAVWEYIRANGAPGAEFLVAPVGANDFSTDRGFTAAREAYLLAIAAAAYAHQSADYYDAPRVVGDVHLQELGYAAWGAREARVWAALEFGQTLNLGPTFASAVLSANKRQVTVNYTRPGPAYLPAGDIGANVDRGPAPFGVGIIPAGQTGAAVPVAASRGVAGPTSLVIDADQDLTGCRLIYPYGQFSRHRAGQFVRDYQSDTTHAQPGLPMRAFITGPLA